METDTQRLQRFHADFEKLKHNREKVPLQVLQTKYERAYNTLVAEVLDGAVWFYRKCIEAEGEFPIYPEDKAGNEWLSKYLAGIGEDEKKPGGLIDQFRTALIDRLDMGEYHNLVNKGYEHRLQLFNRYWQKFWWPKIEGYPDSGCWINRDYTGKDYRYPPQNYLPAE